jgi:hypothetical protein
MADERHPPAGQEQGDEGRDGGRRRYFRRRQRPGRTGREGNGRDSGGRPGASGRNQEQPPARRRSSDRRPAEAAEGRDSRPGRRRRRTRTRINDNATPRPDTVLQEVVDVDDYVTPSSVFVYTHVSRAGSGLDTYEFRAEHFSKGGRTLEDFEIDLSKLFPDAAKNSADPVESEHDVL